MAYFKQTTRKILTQQEKNETIDAVDRAVGYLLERCRSYKMPDFESMFGTRSSFKYMANRMIYLSRSVILIKGSTQPRYLYRERRKSQIRWESVKIAKETGADLEEVKRIRPCVKFTRKHIH